MMLQKVSIYWHSIRQLLLLLLQNRKIPGSNLGRETDYLHLGFIYIEKQTVQFTLKRISLTQESSQVPSQRLSSESGPRCDDVMIYRTQQGRWHYGHWWNADWHK